MTSDSPASLQRTDAFWWKAEAPCRTVVPKPDDLCEACGQGRLAYNDQFQLACPVCGQIAEAGAFT